MNISRSSRYSLPPSKITPETTFWNRRAFLRGLALVAGGAALSGCGSKENVSIEQTVTELPPRPSDALYPAARNGKCQAPDRTLTERKSNKLTMKFVRSVSWVAGLAMAPIFAVASTGLAAGGSMRQSGTLSSGAKRPSGFLSGRESRSRTRRARRCFVSQQNSRGNARIRHRATTRVASGVKEDSLVTNDATGGH